jgi:hypothetical protein
MEHRQSQYSLYLPLKRADFRPSELCDWLGCGKPWKYLTARESTTLNPKETLKFCWKHRKILESLDRKVRRMRGLPPKPRRKKFGLEDYPDV